MWVRQRYAKNVAAYRTRATRAATALVIAIDADTHAVAHRLDQLAKILEEASLSPRTAEEKIAQLVPKRIEEVRRPE
jgi:hypothetical protein